MKKNLDSSVKLNSHGLEVGLNDLLSHYACPLEYDPTPLEEYEGYFIYRQGKGRNEMKSGEKVRFTSGATGTKHTRFELLPSRGLTCAADRFELGVEKHPDGCYNNLTVQMPLRDHEWLIARASHTIQHALNIILKIRDGRLIEAYGDAGAIAFGGLVLGEAVCEAKELSEESKQEDRTSPATTQGKTR